MQSALLKSPEPIRVGRQEESKIQQPATATLEPGWVVRCVSRSEHRAGPSAWNRAERRIFFGVLLLLMELSSSAAVQTDKRAAIHGSVRQIGKTRSSQRQLQCSILVPGGCKWSTTLELRHSGVALPEK